MRKVQQEILANQREILAKINILMKSRVREREKVGEAEPDDETPELPRFPVRKQKKDRSNPPYLPFQLFDEVEKNIEKFPAFKNNLVIWMSPRYRRHLCHESNRFFMFQIDRASYCGGVGVKEATDNILTLFIAKPLAALFTLTGKTTKKKADGTSPTLRKFEDTGIYECIVGITLIHIENLI